VIASTGKTQDLRSILLSSYLVICPEVMRKSGMKGLSAMVGRTGWIKFTRLSRGKLTVPLPHVHDELKQA
jgi:hypothetical protein